MAYRYLDHLTWADVAFEATGETLPELFQSAAAALVQVMVGDLSKIQESVKREITIQSNLPDPAHSLEDLLFQFLEKLVFYKDAELLALKPRDIQIDPVKSTAYQLRAELWGEKIDGEKHELRSDVKAVTYHQFKVELQGGIWRAQVVLDV